MRLPILSSVLLVVGTAAAPFHGRPPESSGSSAYLQALPQAASYRWAQGDRVRVGYRGGDSLRARRILALLQSLPPFPALPDTLPSGVSVYIAPNRPAFDSLAGGTVPEWGAGVALPSRGRIIMPGFGVQRTRGWDEARVLKHEWAHVALQQYLQGLRVPRWFDEGFSQWTSGGWAFTDGWRLRVAFAMGRAPPLDSLVLAWPRDRASAELAYLLSATAVEYLVAESGERGLELLLQRWREERSFPAAFRRVYGVTLGQFEEDWKKYVKRRYGWLFVLSHSTAFWLVLTLALLLMARVRKKRNREAMARLRATEPPDQPAYWAHAPDEGGREGSGGVDGDVKEERGGDVGPERKDRGPG